MRILFVNHVGDMGGAERSLSELAAALAHGHKLDIRVCAPAGALGDALARSGVGFHPIPVCRPRRPSHFAAFAGSLGAAVKASRSLSRRVAELSPHVVHANSATAACLVRPLPGKDRPVLFWHCRDLPKRTLLNRVAAARADRIIAISPGVQQRIEAALPAPAATRTVLIENGIDLNRFALLPERFATRARWNLPQNALLIGMAAHICPWKRHDLFLQAFARIQQCKPEARALIAGSDRFGEHRALRRRLQRMSIDLGIAEKVSWLGDVGDMPAFLGAIDLLIHPAPQEPFGRVVCEAMAAGCPVVASPGGGPADILQHATTGIIADDAEPQSLSRGALALLDGDPPREAIVSAAREKVRQSYDIRSTALKLAGLYRRALDERREFPGAAG